MEQKYKNYLIKMGYSEQTPKGNPSTVSDYVRRIKNVMEWESYESWQDVADNIDKLCADYDIGGEKEKQGATSHNAVISALRRFREFLQSK